MIDCLSSFSFLNTNIRIRSQRISKTHGLILKVCIYRYYRVLYSFNQYRIIFRLNCVPSNTVLFMSTQTGKQNLLQARQLAPEYLATHDTVVLNTCGNLGQLCIQITSADYVIVNRWICSSIFDQLLSESILSSGLKISLSMFSQSWKEFQLTF